MHVFVTGATGTVGAPVVRELLAHDHTVLALARSEDSASAVQRAGAEPLRGGLGDLDVLRDGARRSDGVVHLAFDHDFGSPEAFARAIADDRAALEVFGDELRGSDRPLVVTSGTPWVPGRTTTEDDPLPAEGPVAERARSVSAVLGLARDGVRSSAIRLPRTVHIDGQGGFAGLLTDAARRSGVAGFPGDGEQRWPAVHAADAAVLFRLVLESAPAGSSWHAVADEGVRVRAIAEVVGRRLGLPVEAVPAETFGPLGPIFEMDQPSSGARTQETFGWAPSRPGLLEDLELLEA